MRGVNVLRRHRLALAWPLALCLAVAGCSSSLDHVSILMPPGPIPKGTTLQLYGLATYTDGVTHNITESFSWSSDNFAVATVGDIFGEKGKVSGVAQGSAGISVLLAGQAATTTVTVIDPTLDSISITPANQTVSMGTTKQLTLQGRYSDDSTQDLTSQADWVSSNPLVATVGNGAGSKGLVTTIASGTTTLTATYTQAPPAAGITATTTLTVD